MIQIGKENTFIVSEQLPQGYWLTKDEEGVRLPNRLAPDGLAVGDEVVAFVYMDSEDEPIATTETPYGKVGEFVTLSVVDETPIGAFLDWGLEKDLLLPFKEMEDRPEIDDLVVVFITIHEKTNRLVASMRLNRWFDYEIEDVNIFQPVELLVYGYNQTGTMVVVDGKYRGLLYYNEVFERLRIGQELNGWVRAKREDNRLDVTLQQMGHGGTLDAAGVIMLRLEEAGGTLMVHDKSSPEEIRRVMAMSKKRFKAACGGLYKTKKITFIEGGITKAT
jgi:predicted RNA-binding protein (virulence factor B family)